jgi:hypothetical protein
MVLRTLQAMALADARSHRWRISSLLVDVGWRVPHFEDACDRRSSCSRIEAAQASGGDPFYQVAGRCCMCCGK